MTPISYYTVRRVTIAVHDAFVGRGFLIFQNAHRLVGIIMIFFSCRVILQSIQTQMCVVRTNYGTTIKRTVDVENHGVRQRARYSNVK